MAKVNPLRKYRPAAYSGKRFPPPSFFNRQHDSSVVGWWSALLKRKAAQRAKRLKRMGVA